MDASQKIQFGNSFSWKWSRRRCLDICPSRDVLRLEESRTEISEYSRILPGKVLDSHHGPARIRFLSYKNGSELRGVMNEHVLSLQHQQIQWDGTYRLLKGG